MNDLIPRDDDPPNATAISRTSLIPVNKGDRPSTWRWFCDGVRQLVGLKPIDLVMRFAEAEARKREAEAEALEIENELKLQRAKQDYDLVQAEIRRRDLESQNKTEEANALNSKIRAEARTTVAVARIHEAAAREIERRKAVPQETLERFKGIVDKIRSLGGEVEIQIDALLGDSKNPEETADEEALLKAIMTEMRSKLGNPPPADFPVNSAILTESGEPLLTEGGEPLLTEDDDRIESKDESK